MKLIQWTRGEVVEPVFTCNLSTDEIQKFRHVPYDAPKFSCNTQPTERAVKIVTEAAAEVAGPEAREGYIRARLSHREAMPVFVTKKHNMLSTFDF